MANLIYGFTKCPICGCAIQRGDHHISFPAFVADRDSPLRIFSDAVLHRECFDSHILSEEAKKVYEEALDQFYFRRQNDHHPSNWRSNDANNEEQ